MPVYNGEKFLTDCIESILSQTYNDFEIIIIDDKSSDNSIKIINEFNDIRLKTFSNISNLGLARTLNKAIDLSCNDVIVRIDQDDLMEPNRLSVLNNIFRGNPETKIIFSEATVINSSGKYISELKIPKNRRKTIFINTFLNLLTHSAAAFERDIILGIGGYPEVEDKNFPEDFYVWSKFISERPDNIYFLHRKLVKYRRTSTSFSSGNKELNLAAAKICENNIRKYYGKSNNQLPKYIANKLYSIEIKFRIEYFFQSFQLLYQINKKINPKLNLLDSSYIVNLYLRILIPVKLKKIIKYFVERGRAL